MSYKTIDVKPVSGALGAEIEGVDLSKELSNETFDDIHQAFLDHVVIFFRDQHITHEQHKAFGRRFGTLNIHPYVKGMEGHPEIMQIVKEPEDRINFGGGWHSDMSFLEEPALGSILYAREVPPYGGDTLWANQYLAYETLSDGMKEMLEGLKALHTAKGEYSERGASAQKRSSMQIATANDDTPAFEHPVVRTHPETGRKALYVNPAFTEKFVGMTRRESRPLLNFLFEHCTQEPFTCRFRWTKNAIAFWDNRAAHHFALNDYHGHRRHMERVTVNGDRPH
ncbi:TauD/TfdA family dioxygenase [Parvibaculum sp.]|jgi:taurine dioxygenase|uniref:TauD/TfdA dioxygenase family protein n=1 Tax=Parvibaculum sp. TaxID=2024848 RepID=UPI000C434796|nr:TauD/TfdA family dioxygenase [Parvibaculum sp.]MAM94779.1 taurine dioxygenase [Parvibaculum sp.]|tara:strand:- start:54246 stop:55091 length:846 start_codon:yes stop_codon:yes gene_type:complete